MSTPIDSRDAAAALASEKVAAKKRGSNRQHSQRTRFTGRNSRSLKRMLSQVQSLKGRALTVKERSACVSLSLPLSRDGSYSGGR